MRPKDLQVYKFLQYLPGLNLKTVNIFILAFLFLFLPQQNSYSFRSILESYKPRKILIVPTPAPYPVNNTNVSAPALSGEGVIVTDVQSETVMYEKNADIRLLPASTTKIMTALIALEDYKLDDVVTVNQVISENQSMGLVMGETMTIENLLYGILVHSANDAAYTLAEHHPGGVSGFISRMNEKAGILHLDNTHFANSIGFDDPEQYTTARDLARLSLYAMTNPVIAKMVAIPQITISDTTYSIFHPLKNVNELLGKIPGVSGFKTGFTENAGQALITTTQRQDHKVLTVVLKSQDRFGESEQLINWVFNNFKWKKFTPPN